MHWVIQHNLYHEQGMVDLLDFLKKMEIPHSEHKVIPFIGELEPDLNIDGPVICVGAYSMRHVAKRKNWFPGVYELGVTYRDCNRIFGNHMLNFDAKFCSFYDVLVYQSEFFNDEPVFVRPIEDSKDFAGRVFDRPALKEMWYNLKALGGDADPAGLTMETMVLLCKPQKIASEYRTWVVDGKVVTISQYKQGNRVVYYNDEQSCIRQYAQERVDSTNQMWDCLPAAYVLDVAVMQDGSRKIVELNTLNAAGFYAANVPKLVMALEDMEARNAEQVAKAQRRGDDGSSRQAEGSTGEY
jgi:hypothetical protein